MPCCVASVLHCSVCCRFSLSCAGFHEGWEEGGVALFSVLTLFSVLCSVSQRMGRRWSCIVWFVDAFFLSCAGFHEGQEESGVALFGVLTLFSVLCRVSQRMGRRWGAHSLGVLRPCPLLLGWQKRWAGSLEIRSDRLLLCCWDKILELK